MHTHFMTSLPRSQMEEALYPDLRVWLPPPLPGRARGGRGRLGRSQGSEGGAAQRGTDLIIL